VDVCSHPDALDGLALQAHLSGDRCGKPGHPTLMAGRERVAGLDRGHDGLDCALGVRALRLLGLLAIGDVDDNHAEPDDTALDADRVGARQPCPDPVRLCQGRPCHFDVGELLAAFHHRPVGRLDLRPQDRDHFRGRAAEMSRDRHTVDLSRLLVDPPVAEVRIEENEPHRSGRLECVEQGERLGRLPLGPDKTDLESLVLRRYR
jgi:hypothetical protein